MMNEWQEWLEKIEQFPKLPKQLRKMHRLYKTMPGKFCKTCVNLVNNPGGNKSFYKCKLYGISNSSATDWRQKWEACGKWQETEVTSNEL